MENDEKHLSPEESLRVIRETIDLAKSSIREDGFYFLLWGTLVTFACLTQYYLDVVLGQDNPYWPWMIMPVIGLPVGLLYERQRSRSMPPKSIGNVIREWYGMVWFGFIIGLFIVIGLSVASRVSPVPFILLLAGFATYVSGVLLRFRPLLFGAAALAAGAIACIWVPQREQVLVEAVAIVLGYLAPGFLLNRRRQRSEPAIRPV